MAENSSIFCTICEHDLSDGVIHTHIHEDLGVAVCDPCFKRGHGVSIEPEKRSECCNWCGEIGDSNLFQCGAPKTDSEACERCFCEDCIRRNLGQEELDRRKAPDDDDWCCYCCNDEPLVCKQRELKFFMESNDSSADEGEEEREGKSIQGGKAGTENDEQLQHKIQRKLQRLRDVEEWLGEAAEELDKEDATLEDAIVMELQAQLGSEADQADIVDRAQDEIEVRRRMWGERQDALLDRQAELVEALQALTGLNERELYVQLGLLPDKSHEALPPSHTREEEEDIQAVLEERKNSLEFEREQKSGQEWLEFAKKILSKLEEQESNDNGTMAKAAATMKDKLPTLTNKLANAQNRNEPIKRVREARNELKLLVTNVIDNSWEQFKDEELMTPYIRRELLAFANEVNGKEVQALANSDEQVIDDVLGEGDFAAALTNTINNKSADVSLLSHYKKHLKSEDDLLHEQQGKHQLQLNTVGEDGDKTEDQENLQSEVKERQNERVLAKRRVVDDSVKREANRAQRKRKAAARKKAEAASAAAAAAAAAAAEVRDRKGKKRSRLSLSQKKPAAEDEVVNLVESDEEYNEERTMGARGLPRQKKCMRCRRQPATKAVLVPSENGDVDAGSDRWDVCSECEAKFIWQRTKKKAKHGDEEDEEELKQPSSDAGNESEENNCDKNLAEAKNRGYQKQSSFKEASGAPSDPVVPPGEGARTPSPPLPGNGGGGGAGGRAASPPPPGRRRRPRPPPTANCPGCGERIAEGEEVWWVRAREGGDEVQKKLCAICTAMADSLGQLLSKRQILPDKQSNNNIKSDDQDDTDIKKKIDEQLKQGSSRKHTHLSSKGSKQDWWQSSDSSSAADERRKSAPIKSSVRNSASSSSGSEFELEDDGKAPVESKSEQEAQSSFNYTQMKRAPKTSRDTPIYVDDTDDDEEEDNDDSPVLQPQVKRRDIAPILADAQLKPTTLQAMAAEEARRRRLQERAQRPARLRAGKDKGKGKAPGRARPAGSAGSPAAMDWEEQEGPVAHEEETDAEAGGGEEGLVLERDDQGRPLVTVDFELTQLLKPHQREGVQFMYDNVIERLAEIDKGPGFGAILAHCMGLGKTFQVVVLVYTLLTNQEVRRAMEASKNLQTMRTALILAPSNVTTHWMEEFNKWVPGKLRVWTLGKNAGDRQRTVNAWRKRGGVLIMSHSLFRSLAYEEPKTPDSVEELNNSSGGEETSGAGQCSATATANSKGKKKMRPVEQWAREAFLTPGPDLLVCDEAHVVKNLKAKFSKVIKAVRTRRRLALTGSPMQNNLKEYYTMVDFVRENLLGTPDEFANRFENPIKAGSYEDSSQYHKEIMKRRSHVLHEILKGLVLRRDVSVLSASLPPKSEYVISVKLSKLQKTIQSIFRREWKKEKMNILKLYAKLLVVWGHPAAIKLEDIKEDDETEYDQEYLRKLRKIIEEKQESGDLKLIETGSKVVILLELLAKSMQLGDKVLVFSQSLRVISYIEAVLCGKDWARGLEATPPENFGAGVPFKKNIHYYRLDGSVDSRERQVQFKSFNGSSKAKVFLVSTKAGNMGANLFGANRVVIFDSSFNPANDLQAMFRAYRYGQRKPVYVYRLLAHRSMEEKIYTRQVNKAGLAGRVIDDKQIKQMFTTQEIEDLTSMDKEEVNDPLSGLKNALSSPDPNSQNESSPHQGGQNDSSSSPIQWLSQTGRNIVSKTMKPLLKAVLGSPKKGVMDSFHERHREAFQGGGAAGRPGGGGGGGDDEVLAHLLRLERSLVATHHPHEKCLEDAPQESLTAEQSAAAMREYEEERDRPPPLLLGLGGGGGGRRVGGGGGALLRGGGAGGAAMLSGLPATWGGGGPPLPHQMDENGRYVRPPPPPPPSEAAPVFGAEAAAQRVAVLQARGGAIAGHSEGLQGWSKTVLQDLREQELAAVLEASCSFCLRSNLTCDNGYPKCSNCSSRGFPCRNVIRTNPPAQENPSQQGGVASRSVGGDGIVDQEMIVDFTL